MHCCGLRNVCVEFAGRVLASNCRRHVRSNVIGSTVRRGTGRQFVVESALDPVVKHSGTAAPGCGVRQPRRRCGGR